MTNPIVMLLLCNALSAGETTSFLVFGVGRPVDVRAPPAWLAWSVGLRAGFARASSALPGDGGALLPGLALGDVSAVSPQLNGDMKASSLSHVTAVSGANCAVIVAAVMLVGGNIAGRTRVLTTAIVLETRQGRFDVALALGIILLAIAFLANAVLVALQSRTGSTL